MPSTRPYSLILFLLLALLSYQTSLAQEPSLYDKNNLVWLGGFAQLNLNKNWAFHLEYQERRTKFGKTNLQHLSKLSLETKLDPRLKFRLGYAHAQTFAYGLYPLRANETKFDEHRSFQSLILEDQLKNLVLQHRLLAEQRWLLRPNQPPQFLHRLRYGLKIEYPLTKNKAKDLNWSLALNNELMIGFGRQIGVNIFDQNRLSFALLSRWKAKTRLELAYLRQYLVLGRRVEEQRVLQINQGLSLNLFQTF